MVKSEGCSARSIDEAELQSGFEVIRPTAELVIILRRESVLVAGAVLEIGHVDLAGTKQVLNVEASRVDRAYLDESPDVTFYVSVKRIVLVIRIDQADRVGLQSECGRIAAGRLLHASPHDAKEQLIERPILAVAALISRRKRFA